MSTGKNEGKTVSMREKEKVLFINGIQGAVFFKVVFKQRNKAIHVFRERSFCFFSFVLVHV